MGERIRLASVSDIPPGERRFYEVEGRAIALLNVDGEFHAIENFCPHMGGPVGNGPVERSDDQTVVKCPVHEWRFDLETGDVVFPGKKRVIRYETGLETYDVDEDEGAVYVEL